MLLFWYKNWNGDVGVVRAKDINEAATLAEVQEHELTEIDGNGPSGVLFKLDNDHDF